MLSDALDCMVCVQEHSMRWNLSVSWTTIEVSAFQELYIIDVSFSSNYIRQFIRIRQNTI